VKSFVKYWLPVLIWLAFIFIGSTDLLSAEHTSRFIGPILRWFNPNVSPAAIAKVQFFIRKAAHLTEYAILAALIWRALWLGRSRAMKMSILFVMTLLACAVFAASDEFHQSFIPSRTASPIDVMIDICGALVGLIISWIFAQKNSARAFASAPN
jgi:VanZ family protein